MLKFILYNIKSYDINLIIVLLLFCRAFLILKFLDSSKIVILDNKTVKLIEIKNTNETILITK